MDGVVEVVASRRRSGRVGFCLTELLVAVVLIGVIGVALFSLLSCGARSAVVASEHQLAALLTARTMDQLVSFGYRNLSQAVGVDEELDVSLMSELGGETAGSSAAPVTEDFVFSGRYSVEKAGSGLLRLSVTLSWHRSSEKQSGSLAVTRYLANPSACVSVRESFGGGQA